MPRKCKNQTGGSCHTHVNKVKSVLVGSSPAHHNDNKKGGNGTGRKTVGVTPYQRYNNGGSDMKAAMKATNDANAAQQKAIAHSGGKQKRKTKKVKKNKRRKTKKVKKAKKSRKHKKKHYKRKTKKNKKNKKKRLHKHKKKGGSAICGSNTKLVVPTFKTGGKPVGPVTASSMSQTGNKSSLNAGCQASGDCYATGTCVGGSGGSSRRNVTYQNHHDVFPIGSFGSSMTGIKRGGYTAA